MTRFGIQHTSLQFSDSPAHQAEDIHALFAHARDVGNVILTGTEASSRTASHDLIREIGPAFGFYTFAQRAGEWVAVARDWAKPLGHGYVHVLDGLGGNAAQGAHQPRGITYVQVAPHDRTIGTVVTAGAFHLMTHRSDAADPQSNLILQRALGTFARRYGRGRRLVFANGDANIRDNHLDVYAGSPLTTCWDELGKYPGTHGPNTIDVIGSYDQDHRVRCVKAVSLTDREALRLHTDHNLIQAVYEVRKPR